MARGSPSGDPHAEALVESLQPDWNDDGDGWGSNTGRNVHKTPPNAAGSLRTLQKQRKTSSLPNRRRPSLLFSAFVIVAVAGGISAGWWWTSAENQGSGRGVERTNMETELDDDIHKVTHAGRDGIKGDQRGSFASASDVVDQQLAELGLKRRSGSGRGGPGLLRWSRFGMKGQRAQNPGEMRLGKGGGDKLQGGAASEAVEEAEGLDHNGIGGGGVLVESSKAVFGADRHAQDAQQPAHMRVGMSGALPGGANVGERSKGEVANLALEQQSYFGMGDKD